MNYSYKINLTYAFSILLFLMIILINFQKLIFFYLNETIALLWVVIIMIFCIRILFKKKYNTLTYNMSYQFTFIFIFYILFHFIFISLDDSLSNGIYSLYYILFFPIVFFLLELKINTMLKLIAHLLIISSSIQVIALYMDMVVLNEPFFKMVTPNEEIVRYYGISTSVAVLGIQLASGALMSLGLYFKTNRVFYLILFFIFFTFLYQSNVRAPLLYFIIVVIPILIIFFKIKMQSILMLVFLISLIFISYLFLFDADNYLFQVFSVNDPGNIGRIERYNYFIEIIGNYDMFNLFFGVGSGQLSFVNELTIESSILKIILELGLIGFLIPFILVFFILVGFIINYRNNIIKSNIYFLAFFVLILLQSCTFEFLKTWIGMLYFCFGMVASIKILAQDNLRGSFLKICNKILYKSSPL